MEKTAGDETARGQAEMTGAAKKTGLCNRAALLKAPTASRLKETQDPDSTQSTEASRALLVMEG